MHFNVTLEQAARKKVDEFLALVPKEALDAAASQFAR